MANRSTFVCIRVFASKCQICILFGAPIRLMSHSEYKLKQKSELWLLKDNPSLLALKKSWSCSIFGLYVLPEKYGKLLAETEQRPRAKSHGEQTVKSPAITSPDQDKMSLTSPERRKSNDHPFSKVIRKAIVIEEPLISPWFNRLFYSYIIFRLFSLLITLRSYLYESVFSYLFSARLW